MSTTIMKGMRSWLVTAVVAIGAQWLLATAAVAEEDHLVGYKIKDVAGIQPPSTYDLTNAQQGGSLVGGSCELKKAKFLLVQGEKNGGDDPRGGPAGKFMCYKAKCAGLTAWEGDDQFGSHLPVPKKAQLVCAPFFETNLPRFVDNGDGTATDTQTGLVWEQKTTAVGSGSNPADPHDVDNSYSWSTGAPYEPTGTAYTEFLGALNGGTSPDGVATTGCFTGHCDWRLPTIEELAGIVDGTQGFCGAGAACIDSAFGPTQADNYWSATTDASASVNAWGVDFYDIGIFSLFLSNKPVNYYVRAVRGGS